MSCSFTLQIDISMLFILLENKESEEDKNEHFVENFNIYAFEKGNEFCLEKVYIFYKMKIRLHKAEKFRAKH